MVEITGSENVYLSTEKTDMRKSIESLSAIVQQHFELDPFSDAMFVFCSSDRQKIKILKWDRNGFWLHYKKLQNGKFKWPKESDKIKHITGRDFRWLLDGLSLAQPRAHLPVKARYLC